MGLYRDVLRRAWVYRWRVIVSISCMIASSSLNAFSIASLQAVFDRLFGGTKMLSLPPALLRIMGDFPQKLVDYAEGYKMELLVLIALFIVCVYAIRGVLIFLDMYMLSWVSGRLQTEMSCELYSHIHTLSLAFFNRTPTGEIMARVTGDVAVVGGSVTSLCRNAIREPFNIISLVTLTFLINWKLAMLTMAVFPIAFYPIVQLSRRYRKRNLQMMQGSTDLSVLMQESFSGIRVVKAFCMEEYERQRFTKQSEYVFRVTMHSILVDILSHPIMETLGGVGIGVGICAGGYFVLSGQMTPGAFIAFLGAVGSLYHPIKRISMIANTLQQGAAGLERMQQILSLKPDVPEAPDAVPLPQIRERLEFAGVHFAYDNGQPILTDISLEAWPGEVVAIVGHSGAGKTTLVNLIPRFYDPTQGSVRIDGRDLRGTTFQSLRGQMGIVTQETFLFDDTIANNISYGRTDVSPEQVAHAARLANADEFIEALPEKYSTRVGERGVRLSGGQKQRIAIARAILKDPPILILDEATSSLDAESERLVQDALDRVMEHRLTFVIAHRLSTVIRADQILVVEGGAIVERGTHAELMVRGGAYARLYSIQFEAAAAGQQAPVS